MIIDAMKMAIEFLEKEGSTQAQFISIKLSAAIEAAEKQEPVAWVPQFSWVRSIDAIACKTKRSFDDVPLYTTPQPAIPAGMVLVPGEPTEKELLAGINESERIGVPVDMLSMRLIRKAMLAAANPSTIKQLVELVRLQGTLVKRYRNETPLGHQPHMIAHVADEAIAAFNKFEGGE